MSAGQTADGRPQQAAGAHTAVVEGITIGSHPRVAGSAAKGQRRFVMAGLRGELYFDDKALSKHALFLGGIGTGKTNAMEVLLHSLRDNAGPDDVFVIFDTKGDFYRDFYRDGDAVISTDPDADAGGVTWNLFRDLPGAGTGGLGDDVYEIAATVFSEDLASAGENSFFAAAACDIFAAVVEIMATDGQPHDNADLREYLERSSDDLLELLQGQRGLAGTARYLQGERTPEQILAFLQQTLNSSFTGAFRRPEGTFSVRDFVRRKGGRALFIEYDIAVGSRLLPVYRVLMDLAIKEALSLGRHRPRPEASVFFVMDEFALLPRLSHVADGINFGRSLGLKFLVATQNVNQVLHAYGAQQGSSILSGFGTVFAFRLMDDASRDLVRQRFGANRKQVSTYAAVRTQGVHQVIVPGNVIEDWDVSSLGEGWCVVSLPDGPPFFFQCVKFPERTG